MGKSVHFMTSMHNSINSNFSTRGASFNRDGFVNSSFSNPMDTIFQEFRRDTKGGTLNSGFDWNTDYKKTFAKEDQEFVLAYQLSGNTNNSNNIVEQNGFPIINEDNDNDGKNLEHTIQLDYTHPFSKKNKNRWKNTYPRHQK